MNELSPTTFLIASAVKVLAVFTALMVAIMYATWAERRLSAFIQDRLGPNRVGPFGLLQPIADGLKNIIKEETSPATASRFFFVLGPMLSIMPALVTIAVIPFAAPLPTPWGTVDMVVADLPVGVLYILAISSLGVYGIFLGGWSSNNKYALLGGMRASAQMVSYEVGLGLSLIPVMMLAGNVTPIRIVADQQVGLWYILPLSLAFLLFLISAFAETNRLPFDMPEAESELVTGYHTEYSSMKFSMFFIAEYAHVIVASALMATLFLGGWDIPFWSGDTFIPHEGGYVSGFTATGEPIPARPSVWTTLLTLGAFALKTTLFVILYIWVRWTLPRFRYDQVMHLGWKVMLPTALAYVMLVAGTILVLDQIGVSGGSGFALALTAVSLVATVFFVFYLDRGRIITGAAPVGRAHGVAPASKP